MRHGGESGRKEKVERFDIKCFSDIAGVTLWYRMNNDVVRLRTGMVRKLEDRADAGVLRWFGHMVRMDNGRYVERVMELEASGSRPRGRPKFGWMDGVD